MKYMHLTIVATYGITLLSSSAASLSVSNISQQNGTSFVLTDSMNDPISTGFGFIAVFEFADADVPSTASLLKQNNTIGQLGLVSLDATNSPEDGAVFATIDNVTYVDINDLYIVIGDNSSIASATELALVQASGLVLQSGGGGADTLGTYDLDKSSDVSIGTVGTGIFDYTAFGQPNYSSNSLALSSVAAIPEPSSLALSGLALFALAGRRSRK